MITVTFDWGGRHPSKTFVFDDEGTLTPQEHDGNHDTEHVDRQHLSDDA